MKIPLLKSSSARREALFLSLLILVVLATRLPFLMHGLDEWDSANFALSVVHFDVMAHQPHPPGQLVYVWLMQFINLFVHNELFTLSLASIVCSTLALVPYYLTLRQIFAPRIAMGAAILTAFTYGFWITSLRMISDPVACLFVYGVVCLLLAGLRDGRWFLLGMALCGLTLGVKQTTVYFLAPFVIAVNLAVLFRHGVRRPLLGSLLLLLAVAAWLLPTVSNAHGWANYVSASRTMQRENYNIEALIFHFSKDGALAQGRYDLLQPWGAGALAVVMVALAAYGFFRYFRRGFPAQLFALFGVSVVFYAFFFLFRFNKYYVYYVPVYCAFAAAALFAIGDALARRWQQPGLGLLVPGMAIALITGIGIGLTSPLLSKICHFRAPPQAALEALRKMPGVGEQPLLLADAVTPARELLYFSKKNKVDLLNYHANLQAAVAALNAGRKVYFLSSVPFAALPGDSPSVRLLGDYTWLPELYEPLQGRMDLNHLLLYELSSPLPVQYKFDAATSHPPLLEEGMWEDGWCGPSTRLVLPCDAAGANLARIQITSPAEFGFHYPYQVVCQFADGSRQEFTFTHPGGFDFVVSLPDLPGAHTVEMQLLAPLAFHSPDPRLSDHGNLSLHLDHLDCVTAARPLISQRENGWYDPETDGTSQWRWTDGDSTLAVLVDWTGTLVLEGAVRSLASDNAMEVLVDDRPVVTQPLSGQGWEPLTWRLPVAAGFHRVTLHSRIPGASVPGDGRRLAVCVRDLVVKLEH